MNEYHDDDDADANVDANLYAATDSAMLVLWIWMLMNGDL